MRKGKQVNIPVLFKYPATKALFLTLLGRLSLLVCSVNQHNSVEYLNGEKQNKAGTSSSMRSIADPWSP